MLSAFHSKVWAINWPGPIRMLAEQVLRNGSGHLESKSMAMGYRDISNFRVSSSMVRIYVTNPMIKGYGCLGRYATDPEILADLVDQAAGLSWVKDIEMFFDTPGGTVAGTERLAQAVKNAAKKKKVSGYVDGLCCSAGYWVASQCTTLVATETSSIGSIGVRLVIVEFSKMDQRMGIQFFEFESGKWKSMGTDTRPPTEEESEELKKEVMDTADIFFRWAGEGRGIPKQKIKALEAGVFQGTEAKKIGLIDDVVPAGSMEHGGNAGTIFLQGGKGMSQKLLEALKAAHAGNEELIDAVYAQAEAGLRQEIETAKGEVSAVKAENTVLTEKLSAAEFQKEKAMGVAAKSIIDGKVGASRLPGVMQEDLAALMDPARYADADGFLDAEAFSTAVGEKITSWEAGLPDTSGGDSDGGEPTGFGTPSSAGTPGGHGGGSQEAAYSADEISKRRGGA